MLREQTAHLPRASQRGRTDLLDFYAQPGPMTDPQDQAYLLDDLPADIPSLVKVVQGVMVHIFWAERYGLTLSDERKQEVNLRFIPKILARINELDPQPLTVARPLDKKIVGNCRDHTTLFCAILRHQGVPARARCGFGAYFTSNHYEDHWVGEYWNADQQRWILVDAQLDHVQCEALHIQFDPLDVPRDQFITGGPAWQMIRMHGADPDSFGIFEWHGQWFAQNNVVRDFLAFNKIELLPWDGWDRMVGPGEPVSAEDLAQIDRIAALTIEADAAFDEMRALYESDPRLHTRPEWWK
jgi:hypothetical protein